eukprot:gene8956-10611_t
MAGRGRERVDVLVEGGGRKLARSKDSYWAQERLPLERLKGDSFAEVILSKGDGGLLEGLVSNLFIVLGPDTEGTAANSDNKSLPRIQTAEEGVLEGTMRAAVIRACHECGYTIEYKRPHARDEPLWQEAFLCGTGRLVQPIGKMQWEGGRVIELKSSPGEVTRKTSYLAYIAMAGDC